MISHREAGAASCASGHTMCMFSWWLRDKGRTRQRVSDVEQRLAERAGQLRTA